MGRNGQRRATAGFSQEILAPRGIAFYETDRGGDATYHGPGQIVGYPILDLREWKRDVRAYFRDVEQFLIDALAVFGISAERMPEKGYEGVWVNGAKDSRDWHTHQPVDHIARICSERGHGFDLFPIHRSVRFDEASLFAAQLGLRRPVAKRSSKPSPPRLRTYLDMKW